MSAQHDYLGEILVRRGVVPPERLATLFDTIKERGQGLTELVVSTNIADETKIAQALADECGVGFVAKVDVDTVPLALVSKVPITYAKQHKILPVAEDDGTVFCVIADPFDTTAIDDVRALFGKPVEIAVATSSATPTNASTATTAITIQTTLSAISGSCSGPRLGGPDECRSSPICSGQTRGGKYISCFTVHTSVPSRLNISPAARAR